MFGNSHLDFRKYKLNVCTQADLIASSYEIKKICLFNKFLFTLQLLPCKNVILDWHFQENKIVHYISMFHFGLWYAAREYQYQM